MPTVALPSLLSYAFTASVYSFPELTNSGAVKLQKEREKTEKERKKEKRREKKEKKDKSKGDKLKTEDKKHGHKKRAREESSKSAHKAGDYKQTAEDENEQLERSSLTEEHGCSAAIQNLYDSSDSTQNSSKRAKLDFSETTTQNAVKRNQQNLSDAAAATAPTQIAVKRNQQNFSDAAAATTPTQKTVKRSQQDFSDATTTATYQNTIRKSQQQDSSDTTTTNGSGIRIRLPLLRHKDVESPTSSEQPCFSGRRTSSTAPPKEKLKIPGHSTAPRPPSSSSGQPCFSRGTEATTPSEASSSHAKSALPEPSGAHPAAAATFCESSSVSRSSSRVREMDRQYKKLIRDWTPPLLQTENPFDDDLDWLMAGASANPRRAAAVPVAGGEAALHCVGPASARASYIPEFGIHALPYVVPF